MSVGGFLQANNAVGEESQLNIGMTNRAPWSFVSKEGVKKGIDVEIVKEIEKRLGVKINIQFFPWKRCLHMLQEGEIDLIARFSKTADREKFSYYIKPPYTKDAIVFYVKTDSDITINSYEELSGKTIGLLRGNAYAQKFDSDTELLKEPVDSKEQLFKMLESGRVDVVAIYEISSLYYLSSNGLNNLFRPVKFKLQRSDADFFGFSRKSTKVSLISDFERVVEKMVSQGEINKIIDSFY